MSADIIRQLAKNNESVADIGPFRDRQLTSFRGHAKNHKPSISFKDMPNQKAVIVISCMDPRCNPNEFFNFGENGPPVIRNGGGRAKDALRSLHVLSSIMGYGKNTLGAVAVVHHTDCGLINFDDKFIQEKIKDRMSDSPELVSEVDKMDFGSFSK